MTVREPKKILPPLVNGDHLDQKTFHERYEAMPDVCAELIGGIVFVTSRQKMLHGIQHSKLSQLAGDYVDETPGVEGCLNATPMLGPDAAATGSRHRTQKNGTVKDERERSLTF
jgi:hypothetical protein